MNMLYHMNWILQRSFEEPEEQDGMHHEQAGNRKGIEL